MISFSHIFFSATVTDLQAKMETLTTTNALMKEDLAIAKNSILHLQEDNDRLRKDKGLPTQQQQEQLDREVSCYIFITYSYVMILFMHRVNS